MQIPRSNTEPQKDQVSGARFTYQNMKAKLFAARVECLVIILHLATFILSRLVYNYVLNENGKDTFDFWTHYFHSFPANLFISLFVGSMCTYFASKRREVPNILPGIRTLMELFENALNGNVPDRRRHELLTQFSRYILLTWLLTMREFSKPLRTKFPNYVLIQEVLHLTDMERHALEEIEKENQPMSRAADGWLKAMVKDIDKESGKSFYPGEAKVLNQAINKLKQDCDGVRKFFETVDDRFRLVSCFALHGFGCLSVFGIKNGMTYLLSPYAITYYCMYLANDIHRVNGLSFDDFGYQMTEIFEQEMYDRKVFLETYNLSLNARLMYDSKKTSLEFL